ncbi:MAG: VWA domain-containing protein [Spirochaetales bacterium]|nr:VWA domain-containing protein [Spirochaetales bacterium]
MAMKPQGLIALLFPIAFIGIVFAAVAGGCDGCGEGSADGYGSASVAKIPKEEALSRLAADVRRIRPREDYVQSRELVINDRKADLADTLPDVAFIDKHFPLTVNPYVDRARDVAIEVFCSTEKSGNREPDNWFTTVAEDFNARGVKTPDGKTVKVKVRYIDSGTGYFYIAAKKYVPDAFSPSNMLWIRMAEASGTPVTLISERLVGNTAGVVMQEETHSRLKKDYGRVDVKAVLDASAQGAIAMGYTNPFASSTGLNFLVTVLSTYAGYDEAKMLSPEVVASFEAFQKGVPYVALTTIQMRESVVRGGQLDAFVLEYQTYLREPALASGYRFIPFGVRHDNPLYGLGALPAEKTEALRALARYAESRSALADRYKFNQDNAYQAPFAIPAGRALVRAQALWKEKKDSGRPVAAVFLSDVSGSMNGYPLKNLKTALREGSKFIDPRNAIGLAEYSTDVRMVLPIARFNVLQQSRFLAAVNAMETEDQTSMFDGILVALSMLAGFTKDHPDYKPMLFVLTDGNTNAGTFENFSDVAPIVAGLGIPVYTIAYGDEANSRLLKSISAVNEAASMNATDEAIVNKIGSLLNAEM